MQSHVASGDSADSSSVAVDLSRGKKKEKGMQSHVASSDSADSIAVDLSDIGIQSHITASGGLKVSLAVCCEE